MKALTQLLCIVGLLIGTAATVFGLNFEYFTDFDKTRFGERIKFWHGDTLNGPVRSNDTISIMQDPLYNDFCITTTAWFPTGSPYNPQFSMRGAQVFYAPRLEMPTNLDSIRHLAAEQGHVFAVAEGMKGRVLLGDHNLRIWWALAGSIFDTTAFADYPLPDSAVVFFECPNLEISGFVYSILILGTSGKVGLLDNLLYASSNPADGRVIPHHPEKFALLSERQIYILNTTANGRENSSGRGHLFPAYSNIALNGFYFALDESFTFDQQNDPDSGYVCTCSPDDRGTVYLSGGLTQRRRGYVHRGTRTSTGYLKKYRYDNDLKFWKIPFFNARENEVLTSSIQFGNVAVGDTARDSVRVVNDYVPIKADSVRVNPPFFYVPSTSYQWTLKLPIRFIPQSAGEFSDTVHFYNAYYRQWFAVRVSGASSLAADDAKLLQPLLLGVSAYPNPFNAQTRLRISLPQSGRVRAELFDLLGKKVATLLDGNLSAGEHSLSFDGASLSSGIYFVRVAASQKQTMLKLALMK